MNTNFPQKILHKIEEMRLSPLPPWLFLVKKWAVYVLLVLSVLLGALSLAYSVWGAQEAQMLTILPEDPSAIFFSLFSLWGFVFLIFVGSALWSIENTERGYRVPLLLWILSNLAVTGALALVFLAVGIPEQMDPLIEAGIPPMSRAGVSDGLWDMPGRGRVHGMIMQMEPSIVLEDPMGMQWNVLVSRDTRMQIPLEEGRRVGILGDVPEPGEIHARVIVPARKPLPRQLPPKKLQDRPNTLNMQRK
ncbi:hypothetical protein COW46_04875 [Candidatus Gracilibacteria bacterium CG17_big_fil_post_rev_8_21_14_2_50_48_13]|nr:MAG: hypothetical protein COW46_04875 [Candidatus Gracilibacteria bacterium CG17_big_fil_post_rev_8_21_14_2_50_48_13]